MSGADFVHAGVALEASVPEPGFAFDTEMFQIPLMRRNSARPGAVRVMLRGPVMAKRRMRHRG